MGGPAYCQDDVPVREIKQVTGHAVRAMYLYTAMTDIVHASGDSAYAEALHRVWTHTVERNMYITGGIGPSRHNEGFTSDYDLPNETAYCETCAAIAMVFWNHRMNLTFGDGKYADVVEREMYNGVLSGISLSGDQYFYENPLASQGDIIVCPGSKPPAVRPIWPASCHPWASTPMLLQRMAWR
ncbi:beta-L-arabinofuranosidase domain-containing protein [Paenibacillus rhizoplanae]